MLFKELMGNTTQNELADKLGTTQQLYLAGRQGKESLKQKICRE